MNDYDLPKNPRRRNAASAYKAMFRKRPGKNYTALVIAADGDPNFPETERNARKNLFPHLACDN